MKTIKDFKLTTNAKKIEFMHPTECIPTEDQETIINIGRKDKLGYIHTSDQTMITRLSKLFNFDIYEYYVAKNSDDILQVEGMIPRGRISFINDLSSQNTE